MAAPSIELSSARRSAFPTVVPSRAQRLRGKRPYSPSAIPDRLQDALVSENPSHSVLPSARVYGPTNKILARTAGLAGAGRAVVKITSNTVDDELLVDRRRVHVGRASAHGHYLGLELFESCNARVTAFWLCGQLRA